ncbi:hypothetical protein [Neorhodopirellula pilleata]|uniref:Uncharacterized protein n=1 Tax=Neorhodopirellula pilleata TaxID=2714738 RepID=A0A5C6AVI9_9BACT|nr:hypothetical protein [Neorhodopirellula pilleata]TWU03219.1 hypothetical protein Pla100_01370 [Neorhodopirellula pilleata]
MIAIETRPPYEQEPTPPRVGPTSASHHYHQVAIENNRSFMSRLTQERPAVVLASAALIGMALGWIVKRKI